MKLTGETTILLAYACCEWVNYKWRKCHSKRYNNAWRSRPVGPTLSLSNRVTPTHRDRPIPFAHRSVTYRNSWMAAGCSASFQWRFCVALLLVRLSALEVMDEFISTPVSKLIFSTNPFLYSSSTFPFPPPGWLHGLQLFFFFLVHVGFNFDTAVLG